MTPEQLNAVLLQRLERLEALLVAKTNQIAAQGQQIERLEAELRDWKSGSVGPTNRQRRRVKGAKPARDKPNSDKPRPAGRKKGHNGAGRKKPKTVDVVESRRLDSCPGCSGNLIDKGSDTATSLKTSSSP